MSDVDLINRDPNQINDHLQCRFEDVIAEPEGTHSIDCVWKLSYTCFSCWKGLCYKISTLLCGICLAAQWACSFAQISFCHIWCFTPYFKYLDICCGCYKKLWTLCVSCCLDPLCESCGGLFHAFKKN
ncbi:caveolin-3-like [Mya arenaria]|nr:caveolin-3-like [Mya arenaria]